MTKKQQSVAVKPPCGCNEPLLKNALGESQPQGECRAIKPIAPYLGGKLRLSKTLVAKIEATPHKTYAEPFVGMGGVFLRRTKRVKAEFINDYNNDVANLFRIIQRHKDAFIGGIRYMVSSRAEFKRYWDIPPHTLTDIDRAIRFYYLHRQGFGGKVGSKTFGVCKERNARFSPQRLQSDIDALAERLSDVTIECLDFGEFIERYDHKDMLFYLDPPYWNCENDYGKDLFCKADFERLAGILKNINGKFILSINDTPEIREIFKGFTMEQVTVQYSICKDRQTKAGELIICN